MGGRVVVVGASMAGLLAARRVLEHADEVVIIERDALDAEGSARRGVPQGRHTHVLLAAGERRLERWFPGIGQQLVAAGAVRGDAGDGIWYQAGGLRVRQAVGITGMGVSRPLLESTVRHRLLAEPGVRIERGVSVEDVTVHGGRVTGVVAGGETVEADLVVDCSGRRAPLLTALTAAGFAAPPVDAVHVGISYGTRTLRRGGTDIGAMFCITAHAPPHEPRIGVLVAIEGDRWIVTLGGYHGDDVPTDDEGFLAYARSLPSPVIAGLLERAEPLGPVMTFRMPTNQRRRVERLRRPPAGYVLLGDAICSFNPIYGQGMTVAALEAEALGGAVARHGLASEQLPRAFYRRAARIVANPWRIAVGADFLHPATTGPKPVGTDLLNRYVRRVHAATHTSVPVLRRLQLVQNLLADPQSLLTPLMVARVLTAARRSTATLGSDRRGTSEMTGRTPLGRLARNRTPTRVAPVEACGERHGGRAEP